MKLKTRPKLRIPISAVLEVDAFDKLERMFYKEINEGKKSSKNAIINRIIMAYVPPEEKLS